MAKFKPNEPCFCGSGKKFKRCHSLIVAPRPIFQMNNEFGGRKSTINFFSPPDIYCDTNIWRSMTAIELGRLAELQAVIPVRYWFSIINYIEMISHLGSTDFHRVRSWFQRVHTLCDGNILPSPEWEFMASMGMDKYIHPYWVVNKATLAARVHAISVAASLDEIPGWKTEVEHYQKLRATDDKSFSDAISRIRSKVGNGRDNIRASLNHISAWFLGCLAPFFLLTRPSQGRMRFKLLSKSEQDRFCRAFLEGSGQLFNAHCTAVLATTFKEGKKLDPNDLNDMVQLLLATSRRVFVTNEKLFRIYTTKDPQAARVITLPELLGSQRATDIR